MVVYVFSQQNSIQPGDKDWISDESDLQSVLHGDIWHKRGRITSNLRHNEQWQANACTMEEVNAFGTLVQSETVRIYQLHSETTPATKTAKETVICDIVAENLQKYSEVLFCCCCSFFQFDLVCFVFLSVTSLLARISRAVFHVQVACS